MESFQFTRIENSHLKFDSQEFKFDEYQKEESRCGPHIKLASALNSPFSYLERIRRNSRADFLENGVDVELDDFDVYRAQLRGQNISSSIMVAAERENRVTWNGLDVKKACADIVLPPTKKTGEKKRKTEVCVFCRNSKKPEYVYKSHVLKDSNGTTICPILRRYRCPLCGFSGDKAHTIKYCPFYDGVSASAAGVRRRTNESKRTKQQ